MKIRKLDDQTINQIAAGEVVENVACALKELVENSLDAGATSITVEAIAGGRGGLKVIDNGWGMSKEDARLALQRHTTSKLQKLEDFDRLITMGFRGEALPSIASISRLLLLTCEEGKEGHLLQVEGGSLMHEGPAARAPGTTIEIKDLFYNTPARRKFQKSISYDQREMVKTLTLLALSSPHVAFQLLCNQTLTLSAPAHSHLKAEEALEMRIRDLLGEEFFKNLQPFTYEEDDIRFFGFLSAPSFTRQNRSGQYLFINRRGVSCPLVSHAIAEGYGTLLTPRRYPLFVLHMEMPADLIDANVHPQKKEVRLRKEGHLRALLTKAVHRAFQKPTVIAPSSPSFCVREEPSSLEPFFISEEPTPQNVPLFAVPLSVLGVWRHYILVEGNPAVSSFFPSGLLLIDHYLAHFRLLFEEFSQRSKTAEIQPLLLPLTLTLPYTESLLLKEHLEELTRLGFEIRPFGSETFLIEALPKSVAANDIEALINDIVKELALAGDLFKREREKKVILAASQASIRRLAPMTLVEAHLLVTRLMRCENPHLCPRGKPLFVCLTAEEISKRLKCV